MTTDHTNLLPAGFEELEEFAADWALPLESARMRKRWSSSMDEITRFYDFMATHIEAALDHLDGFDLKAMPAREQRLLLLTLSLAEAASAVETYKEPGVKYGFASPDRYVPTETVKR
jgi:hypothetical protein